ncbi:MAG: hypothetical protein FWF29_05355 [Treponema sp.]|nr:hypothetical protein [Treponema sp.]
MPLPMVHLSIAKIIMDTEFKINNRSQFCLGSISPDAIHMRANTNRQAKNNTHLIPAGQKPGTVDKKEFFKLIMNFIHDNCDKTDSDFLWGYGIHSLTDMYWSQTIYADFKTKYGNDKSPVQDERPAYYNDTDVSDLVLFAESSCQNEIWQYLQKAEYFDFLDILSAQEIKAWNERTLGWYDLNKNKQYNPVRYITRPEVENFIKVCSELICSSIKADYPRF